MGQFTSMPVSSTEKPDDTISSKLVTLFATYESGTMTFCTAQKSLYPEAPGITPTTLSWPETGFPSLARKNA